MSKHSKHPKHPALQASSKTPPSSGAIHTHNLDPRIHSHPSLPLALPQRPSLKSSPTHSIPVNSSSGLDSSAPWIPKPQNHYAEVSKRFSRQGEIVLQHFRIVRPLNSGACATIYLARQLHSDRLVAVKIAHPHLALGPYKSTTEARFLTEFRAATRIQHPGLASALIYGKTEEGLPAIAMELIPGRSLTEILERYAPVKAKMALSMCMQLGSVLDTIHRAGIIHRDISPDNIVVTRRPTDRKVGFRLLDFGIAQIDGERLNTRGAIGTPCYIAPEQLRGHSVPRSDIFALGVILLWALTGRHPSQDHSNLYTHPKEIHHTLLQLRPNIPPQLARLLASMLLENPSQRPTAKELCTAVSNFGRPWIASLTIPSLHESPVSGPFKAPNSDNGTQRRRRTSHTKSSKR